MKVLIVFAHAEHQSFNGALFKAAVECLTEAGHEVKTSDLYAMNFDPVSDRRNFKSVKDVNYFKQQFEEMHASEQGTFSDDVAAELEKLEWCDFLLLQFPLWWFGLPGIMKGWVDRVFVMGRIYGRGKMYDRGILSGRRAMLSLTTGGGSGGYEPDGLMGDLHTLLMPINHGILRFVGFDVLPEYVSFAPAHVSAEQRNQYLQGLRERLQTIETTEPIKFPSIEDYDESYRPKKKIRAEA